MKGTEGGVGDEGIKGGGTGGEVVLPLQERTPCQAEFPIIQGMVVRVREPTG